MKATLTLLLVLALTILVTLLGCITPELIERASDAYEEYETEQRAEKERKAQEAQAKAEAAQKAADEAAKEAAANPPASSSTSGGYVWKPVSESNSKLVVLFPHKYKGKIKSSDIRNADGQILEVGKFSGDVHNGNRPHYRYSKSGSKYGKNLKSVATLKNGELVVYKIPNGGKRVDK